MPDKDTTPVVSDEDAARFWAKVDRSGECWRWTGAPDKRGYGRFKIDGQVQYAHRVAYAIQTGQWPDRISWSCDD